MAREGLKTGQCRLNRLPRNEQRWADRPPTFGRSPVAWAGRLKATRQLAAERQARTVERKRPEITRRNAAV